ncbi:MAG: class I SAM-dependent methyltransferase [bacterium]|nr:class I SAM-dependent methyltransferase [bacterium]
MTDSVNFDRAVAYYDETRGFPPGVETHIPPLFVRAGNLNAASRVLEIGIGTGRIAIPLAPHVGMYIGIDISTAMMDRLRAKRTNERIFVVQGDAARLPFADASFDAVTAVHIFHLIPAWRGVLAEVRRVLKPGGALLHGWNGRNTDDTLQAVWEAAIGDAREHTGTVPFSKQATFPLDEGWQTRGATEVLPFTFEQTANGYLDMIRQRKWSHCWKMSDDTITTGLAALEAYAAAHYPNLDSAIQVQANFHVQAFTPPA